MISWGRSFRRFSLFCIFVRNRISVMVIVADNTVEISVITGFLMLLKPDIISIHRKYQYNEKWYLLYLYHSSQRVPSKTGKSVLISSNYLLIIVNYAICPIIMDKLSTFEYTILRKSCIDLNRSNIHSIISKRWVRSYRSFEKYTPWGRCPRARP